jgi:ribosomal protein S12 methylthiotransferase
VAPEIRTDRRNRLMAIQKKISRERLRRWKGRTETALLEGPSQENPMVWEARLQGMAPEIDGKLYLTDIELPDGRLADTGDAVRVEITKTDAYDLIGKVVEIQPRPARPASLPPPDAHEKLHRIATGAALRVLG